MLSLRFWTAGITQSYQGIFKVLMPCTHYTPLLAGKTKQTSLQSLQLLAELVSSQSTHQSPSVMGSKFPQEPGFWFGWGK